ncbi:2'-5' RNA ligase [Nocardioides albertanoniae]|uniref:RNA 2',3'-cyclic phosphodiesterase n=1 Tax=Nocardioides albertanoniae TaxID=1175486 RepID=A0A543A291_9ACTN|nr:RNA 2',3'-cyclic phosphodiesterase [Nocardioides albertanoniae]TQL66698.1 2'-5' RNA ligase [Nocardioides albertanoniae]
MNRMFVAVIPPESVSADLDEFLAVRRDAAAFRWSLADQLHLTLAFAEHVPERSLDDVIERLETAAGRRTPFGLTITGGGAFPDVTAGKVLYAGVEADPADELDRSATGARNALAKAGADVDGGRFRPHLTLARTGQPVELSNWVRLLDAYRGPSWTVSSFALVHSRLGEGPRKHPVHEVVAEFPFG